MLGLGQRLLVVQVALDLDRAARQQPRRDRFPPLDLDMVAACPQRADAGPERLVRILGADALEQAEQVLAPPAASRRQVDAEDIGFERVEIAHERALGLVVLRAHLRPAALEQVT